MKVASTMLAAFVVFAGCALTPREVATRHGDTVRWSPRGDAPGLAVVEVSGASIPASAADIPEAQKLLKVYAGRDAVEQQTPMLGTYRLESGVLTFTPQYPLTYGTTFVAIFSPHGGSADRLTVEYRVPTPASPPAAVAQIYPSQETVPENLLKFYVHFSSPMSRGDIYRHIHLRTESGKEVELPFLELGEELWDPTMTRVTLLIDPGRIKRGVMPLEDIGPALVEGKRFTLSIDKAWLDANGRPLKQGFTKHFRVAAPDRTAIDPSTWKIHPGVAGSRDALTIEFGEALDHALATRMIQLVDSSGSAVAGTPQLADHDHRWTFTPAEPWKSGNYELVIPTTIEDLAGNNIGKAFDVDVASGAQRSLTSDVVKLPVRIK